MRTRLSRCCQPGVLVPLLVLVALTTDVALHALPLDRVSYRVWEALRTFGADRPFRPNARYDRRVYGNLTTIGNQPDLRQYRRVVFTTDSLGYRNPPLANGARTFALLFGSSFSAGAEVSDHEGLAARLTAETGGFVYNAAPGDPAPVRTRSLAHHLRLDPPGLVVFEYFEGNELPPLDAIPPNPSALRCRVVLRSWDSPQTCASLTWLYKHHQVSPLQVFASRAHRRLQNDLILPNTARARVIRARLRNGAEILFHGNEAANYHRKRATNDAERYFTWLANRLALQEQRLVVVLLPQKYTVYAPLLAQPDTGPEGSVAYFDALETRLRAHGTPVVNLLRPLRAAARRALEEDSLVYWRDDTHWNATGTAVAAQAIAPALISASRRTTALARP